MQTKLTLRLENSLIKQAKHYAQRQNKSLSQIVADYFQILTRQTKKTAASPVARSLIGILEGADVHEKDYKKYLEKKYL